MSLRLSCRGVVSSAFNHLVAHSRRTFLVGVIVALKHVGEEEQLEYEKQYEKLHDDECPQISPHCHAAKSVDIKPHNPLWPFSHAAEQAFAMCQVTVVHTRRI